MSADSPRIRIPEPPTTPERVYQCRRCVHLVVFLKGSEPRDDQPILCLSCEAELADPIAYAEGSGV